MGYDHLSAESRIIALLGEDMESVEALPAGAAGYLVSTRTPFYGESGGQLGDTGDAVSETGSAEVTDTLKPSAKLLVHVVKVSQGELLRDQAVTLTVREGQRFASARNHTCTHILHAALRKVLGDHVKQAGSLVGPERLRFDFTHISAMTPEEILAVENEVNRVILSDIALNSEHMAYDDAVQKGAMALFGEKYESEVRCGFHSR